jgi:ApaG protein
MLFEQVSNEIKVEVEPTYVKDQSDPKASVWYFSYHVKITNQSDKPVQLRSRHWIIIDAIGRVEEVEGSGVVGLQPLIPPGEMFEYSSYCPLPTPTGTMRGNYLMTDPKGQEINVSIPLFILAEPSHYH